MSLRKFVNALLKPTKYRLTTTGGLRTIATAKQSPYQIIAQREPPGEIRTVMDLGANVGQTTSELRRLFPQSTIHAFEPTPKSREAFAALHEKDEHVSLWPYAISDEPGNATFHINERSMTNSLLAVSPESSKWVGEANSKQVSSIEVEVKTLNEFCRENDIESVDVLKMDIQGGELAALKGALELLDQGRVRYIGLEVNFVALYEGQTYFHEVQKFLTDHGFELVGLYQLAVHKSGRLLFADALFCADSNSAGTAVT
jgi:FkbM family methyltransferase